MRIDWRSRLNLKQCSPIAVSLLLFLSTAAAGTAPALGQEPPYMTQVREHINKGNGLLGRRLFADPRLSSDGRIACADEMLTIDPVARGFAS